LLKFGLNCLFSFKSKLLANYGLICLLFGRLNCCCYWVYFGRIYWFALVYCGCRRTAGGGAGGLKTDAALLRHPAMLLSRLPPMLLLSSLSPLLLLAGRPVKGEEDEPNEVDKQWRKKKRHYS